MNTTAQYPAALPAIDTLEAEQLVNELSLEHNATAMRFEVWWQSDGTQMRNDPIVSVAYAAFCNGAVNSQTPIIISKELPIVGLYALAVGSAIIGAIAATIAFHLVS